MVLVSMETCYSCLHIMETDVFNVLNFNSEETIKQLSEANQFVVFTRLVDSPCSGTDGHITP